ncbi:MAG: putative sugar nucleotidyl transferase [Crocinitomicaceae bacterium]
MKFNLSDFGKHKNFAPLSLTRPIGSIRVGIMTNTQRYAEYLPEAELGFHTESYLEEKYPSVDSTLSVNACVIPNQDFIAAIVNIEENSSLFLSKLLLAKKGNGEKQVNFLGEVPVILNERWDIFQLNHTVLKNDFELITENRSSKALSNTNLLIGSEKDLFIEEGATIEGSILNTTNGPIYIGKNAEIMEGSMVRGGLALCKSATIKMGTKIYGATTIGPHCKVGGEVNNVIFQEYSNKGHDGFLGNSIIGAWCNLGADTNTSNLKNNYSNVKTYSYSEEKEIQTELKFIGLSMGDYSKCAINTMFNTASVVGVACNIFTDGFPKKHITSFSWINGQEESPYKLEKAYDAANNMMSRRALTLSDRDKKILAHLSHSPS